MLLFKKVLLFFLYTSLVLLVVTFEKVIGLPVIFLSLVVIAYDYFLTKKEFSRYVYLATSTLLLAVVYQVSLVLALLLLQSLVLVVGWLKGQRYCLIKVVLVVLFIALLLAWFSGLTVSIGVISYLIFSIIVALLLLLKFMFSKTVSEGFLH